MFGYSVTPRWKRARAVVAGADLADQIEPRDLAVGRAATAAGDHGLLADLGDHADDHGLAGDHADEFSDGRIFAADRTRGQLDGGLRAGDGDDAADHFGSARPGVGACWV